jgi:hypothetical protein
MDDASLRLDELSDDRGLPEPMSSACSARASGEHAMLRALLLDAIQCLEYQGCPKRDRERLAVQARLWVVGRDANATFSFANVCAYLGLPADRLRRTLLRLADSARPVDDAASLRRRSTAAEIRARAARNLRIRSLHSNGLRPGELAERFGLSYESIHAICTPPASPRSAVA